MHSFAEPYLTSFKTTKYEKYNLQYVALTDIRPFKKYTRVIAEGKLISLFFPILSQLLGVIVSKRRASENQINFYFTLGFGS